MEAERELPELRQVVLDCTDARLLAEFYRQLLGLRYRPGDEPPAAGEPDPRGQEWLVLQDAASTTRMAFQQVAELPEATAAARVRRPGRAPLLYLRGCALGTVR